MAAGAGVASPAPERWAAPALAAALAGLALALPWRGVDWPAQLYRVHLFRVSGWTAIDTGWYGGHAPIGYSVLFPPLGAALGTGTVAIGAAATAAWAFDRLVRREFGPSARLGSLCFAAGVVVQVAVGQLPFLLGLAVGLLAILAHRRDRNRLAVLAAVACPLCSPVAGLFLGMVIAVGALASSGLARRWLVGIGLATTVPLGLLGLLYHQAGRFPYEIAGLGWVLGICAAAQVLLPVDARVLRRGALVYGAVAAVLFLVPNPVGGNVSRLGAVLALPLLISAGHPPRRSQLAVCAIPLLIWQWAPAFGAISGGSHDPSSHRAYFQPLVAELASLGGGPTRVEVPFTAEHWEAAWVARDIALARGWERQLDIAHNHLFYDEGALSAATYRQWLEDNGVTWVALPDAPLDYSSRDEAALLRDPPDYLQLVWQNAHWRLWRVTTSPGLVSGPARLTALTSSSFTVDADAAGPVVVRLRDDPAWRVVDGDACLDETDGAWLLLRVNRPGPVRVAARLLPGGGTRC